MGTWANGVDWNHILLLLLPSVICTWLAYIARREHVPERCRLGMRRIENSINLIIAFLHRTLRSGCR